MSADEKRVLEKSKRVFFWDEDTTEMDHYVLCSCDLCSNDAHVNCGVKPDTAAILFAINSEGWRYYDEYPATNEGQSFMVCFECVKEITSKYPTDEKILLQEYLNKGIMGYIEKENNNTFHAARKDYGLADVSKDDVPDYEEEYDDEEEYDVENPYPCDRNGGW